MKKFIKIFSYCWPVRLESSHSNTLGHLEVSIENGKKVLNGTRANYSYGLLQEVFRICFRRNRPIKDSEARVLILGFGAGSVLELLRNEYGHRGNVVALELDEEVISLGKKHFPEAFMSVRLIQDNAFTWVPSHPSSYNLIIVDLFKDNKVIRQSYEVDFIQSLYRQLAPGGRLFHNLMLEEKELEEAVTQYECVFRHLTIERLLGLNQVIVAKKAST